MADTTEYESGARKPMPKRIRDENENFSDQAAKNKPPPGGVGNSDPDTSPRDVREAPAPNPPGDAGENLKGPEKKDPSDALKKQGN